MRRRVTDRAVDLDAVGLEGPPGAAVAQHGDVVGGPPGAAVAQQGHVVEGPPGAAVTQHGHVVGGGASDEARADDRHVAVGVDEVAVDGVPRHGVHLEADVVHRQPAEQVDEDGAAEQAGRVVLEVAVDQDGAAALDAHRASLADQRYHALAARGMDPDLCACVHA